MPTKKQMEPQNVYLYPSLQYAKMYENFISQLKMYASVIRVLSKGYLLISLLPPVKLKKILNEV